MEAFEDALERSNRSRDLTSSNYSDASFDKRSRRRGIVAPPPIRTATAEKHALAGLGERSDRWAPPPPVRPPPYSKRQRLKSRAFWQEPWFIWSIVLLVLAGLGVGIFVVIHDIPAAPANATASSATVGAASRAPSTSIASVMSSAAQPSALVDTSGRSFYGICYEPSQMNDNCAFTETTVEADMKILARLTKRLRIYSSKCEQGKVILAAIKKLNLDIEVSLGVRVDADTSIYEHDRAAAIALLKEHGTQRINRIVVGNEYVMWALTKGALGDQTPLVVRSINDFKQTAQREGIKVAIGTSEAPYGLDLNGKPNLALVEPADFIFVNLHAWWGGAPSIDSAQNTFDGWQALLADFPASMHPKFLLGETGWPASTPGENQFTQQTGAKTAADVKGLQSFLDGFVCKANTDKFPFWLFQLIDEPGKGDEATPEGVENHWGLYTVKNELKPGLKLPTCLSS